MTETRGTISTSEKGSSEVGRESGQGHWRKKGRQESRKSRRGWPRGGLHKEVYERLHNGEESTGQLKNVEEEYSDPSMYFRVTDEAAPSHLQFGVLITRLEQSSGLLKGHGSLYRVYCQTNIICA